jgi:hypothetical protein
MNSRLGLFLAAILPVSPCAFAQIPGVAESHIAGNVPDAKDFRPFLIRDLAAHLKPALGDAVTVDYDLLRDTPTQTGIAYPKFYVWVTATKPDKSIVDGAARVAAIDKKGFQVTTFIPRADIVAHPEALASIFPQLLLDKIRAKAGVKP